MKIKPTAGWVENKFTHSPPPIQIYIDTESGVGVAFSSHFTKAKEDF